MHIIGQQQNKKFKPNVAIDMVAACIAHYKKFNRNVKTITLNEALFYKWKQGIIERNNVKELVDNLEIHDEMVFRNVTVKKGPSVMVKELEVELHKLTIQSEA